MNVSFPQSLGQIKRIPLTHFIDALHQVESATLVADVGFQWPLWSYFALSAGCVIIIWAISFYLIKRNNLCERRSAAYKYVKGTRDGDKPRYVPAESIDVEGERLTYSAEATAPRMDEVKTGLEGKAFLQALYPVLGMPTPRTG